MGFAPIAGIHTTPEKGHASKWQHDLSFVRHHLHNGQTSAGMLSILLILMLRAVRCQRTRTTRTHLLPVMCHRRHHIGKLIAHRSPCVHVLARAPRAACCQQYSVFVVVVVVLGGGDGGRMKLVRKPICRHARRGRYIQHAFPAHNSNTHTHQSAAIRTRKPRKVALRVRVNVCLFVRINELEY